MFNEDSLRDLWDNMRHTNILIIEVSQKEKRGDADNLFEE